MSNNASTEAGVISKADRSKLERISVLSFKPPCLKNGIPHIVFITEAGNEQSLPAAPDLWRFIDGAPRPGKRASGLTHDSRRKFVLYVSKAPQRLAVSVTDYPADEFLYSRAFGAPEDNTEDVHFQIHPTTSSVRVISVPTGTKQPQLMAMIAVLDGKSKIEAGMQLGNESEVLQVNGFKFSASLLVTAASASGQQMT